MYAADGILGSASVRLTLGTGVCSAEHQQLRTECAACSVRTGYVFFGTLVVNSFLLSCRVNLCNHRNLITCNKRTLQGNEQKCKNDYGEKRTEKSLFQLTKHTTHIHVILFSPLLFLQCCSFPWNVFYYMSPSSFIKILILASLTVH